MSCNSTSSPSASQDYHLQEGHIYTAPLHPRCFVDRVPAKMDFSVLQCEDSEIVTE